MIQPHGPRLAYLGEVLLHRLGLIADSEDDIGDTGLDECLDLVDNGGLIAELDERLGEG